jgi:hypothetical protein
MTFFPIVVRARMTERLTDRGRLANHDAIAKTFSADTGGKSCQYARPLPSSRSRAKGTDQNQSHIL